jgi:hypothetical protein
MGRTILKFANGVTDHSPYFGEKDKGVTTSAFWALLQEENTASIFRALQPKITKSAFASQ